MKHDHIRAMQRDDLSRVAHLVDANAMFPSDMLPEMTAPFFDGETDQHRWLVFDKSGVEGVAYYIPEAMTDGTWNVLLIAVDPNSHGKGIGRAIMQYIEDELRVEGQRILLVETSGLDEFERTRGFYDLLGYDREARIRDFYAAGDDKVVFRKALS